MIIEDTKIGQGKKATRGKKVSVRYIGKLTDEKGKSFDSNVRGPPFTFVLGKGEVITGWDLGIEGMLVGGERNLTIPSSLGYGAQGSPPVIPRNAKLYFEVKLLDVK